MTENTIPAVRAHEWKRETATGKPLIYDDEYPYHVQCRLCGETSRIINMGADTLELDHVAGQPCPGINMTVTLYARLAHPGQARDHADRQSVSWTFEIPLRPLSLRPDPLVVGGPQQDFATSLEDLTKMLTGLWERVWEGHKDVWRQRLEASQQTGETDEGAERWTRGDH